jgi:hypothetical protein
LEKNFFFTFSPIGPAASWPIRPFGPAAAHFFLFSTGRSPPLPIGPQPLGRPSSPSRPSRPSSSSSQTGAVCASRHHRSASRRPMDGPDYLRRRKNNDCITPPSFPSSIPGNRRLQSGGIEASSTPATEGTRPPPPHLRPIKGRPPSVKTPTPPTLLLLALNVPSPPPFRAEAPPSVRRPSTAATLSSNSPARPSPPPPLVGALGHQSGRRPSSGELLSAAMAVGPRWTGPARSTGFSLEKQILEIPISGTLHLGPSSFSISTRSP